MEEMWKMLDTMAQNDPGEYKRFIDKQMSEMKQEISKEKEAEDKQRTIVSTAAFSIKAMVAKVIDEKDRKARAEKQGVSEGSAGIKLFDFNDSQIKESFTENKEKAEPLEEPILYLNVVFHDNVVPPLDKGRDLADPKEDRAWLLIPMVFTSPVERINIEGKKCLTYDCHVNKAVIERMREEPRATRSITNYIILKFQEHVEDYYLIHKKSVQVKKKRRYKCGKGS